MIMTNTPPPFPPTVAQRKRKKLHHIFLNQKNAEATSLVFFSAGCLVLVFNYTGDRLNFGLATEQARREGRKVGRMAGRTV